MRSRCMPLVYLAAIGFVAFSWTVLAQAGKTAGDGVYTDAQAARGKAVYDAQCQACHGATLGGAVGPPLSGADFLRVWDKRPLADLVDKIQSTMPATSPGSLSRAQATDIVAHVLKSSAFRAGSAELRDDDTLKQIALVAPPGAPPATARPAGAAALVSSAPPAGNLAQMMRGILFPSSNLIFNVQNQDPGEQKKGWQPGTTPFGWADWGAGIYSGWELVDYAAIAIADAAPLMLMPGRRCENGKPVPVDQKTWIDFTEGMAEAGREAYRASQSRNRDAVIEATNTIGEACLRCHEVYRDKPGGTLADPSNKAARCVP